MFKFAFSFLYLYFVFSNILQVHIGTDSGTEDARGDRLPLIHHHLAVRGQSSMFSLAHKCLYLYFCTCIIYMDHWFWYSDANQCIIITIAVHHDHSLQ